MWTTSLRLFLATRPYALPASIVPALLGTVAANTIGGAPFHPLLFLLTLIAIVLIHSGSNLVNDIYDYLNGVDKELLPGSGALVRGWFSVRQITLFTILILGLGSALGLLIVWLTTPIILWLGLIGVFIGVAYTAKPLSLKYHGLGDLAIALDFGFLATTGAWAVQTNNLSWVPFVLAIPITLLAIAILHANNWRDTTSDRQENIITVANLLGPARSRLYYAFLIFGPYAFITLWTIGALLSTAPAYTAFCLLLPYLSLPAAIGLWKRAGQQPDSQVVIMTAQLNLFFGLLYTAAVAAFHWL